MEHLLVLGHPEAELTVRMLGREVHHLPTVGIEEQLSRPVVLSVRNLSTGPLNSFGCGRGGALSDIEPTPELTSEAQPDARRSPAEQPERGGSLAKLRGCGPRTPSTATAIKAR